MRLVTLLTRRYGGAQWDAVVRGSGTVALAAIPLVLAYPSAAGLVGFVLVTIWFHGPISPFLPASYEPVLLLFGRLYPPLLVATIGTAANLYIEVVNYHLYRGVLRIEALGRFRRSVEAGRLMTMFERRPFFAIWFGTVSPIPDWMGRILAAVADYPVGRYLLAHGLGRFPRFLFFAAVGMYLRLPVHAVLAVTLSSILVTGAIAAARFLLRRSEPAPTTSL